MSHAPNRRRLFTPTRLPAMKQQRRWHTACASAEHQTTRQSPKPSRRLSLPSTSARAELANADAGPTTLPAKSPRRETLLKALLQEMETLGVCQALPLQSPTWCGFPLRPTGGWGPAPSAVRQPHPHKNKARAQQPKLSCNCRRAAFRPSHRATSRAAHRKIHRAPNAPRQRCARLDVWQNMCGQHHGHHRSAGPTSLWMRALGGRAGPRSARGSSSVCVTQRASALAQCAAPSSLSLFFVRSALASPR